MKYVKSAFFHYLILVGGIHSSLYILGYFRKKNKQGGWGDTFLKNTLDFFIFLLYPWKFQTKQSSTPHMHLEVSQNCFRSLGNFKAKSQDSWKFHITFFFFKVGNSTSFLINPWKLHAISLIPLEIPYLQSPLFYFFLE